MEPPTDYEAVTPEQIEAADENVSELEVEAALAQVSCDSEAYGAVSDRWAALETQWMEAHSEELAEINEFERVLLPATAMDPALVP
ncbi:MAG: hypothetical protein ACK5O2_15895 [Microthrixaceae bacterium]